MNQILITGATGNIGQKVNHFFPKAYILKWKLSSLHEMLKEQRIPNLIDLGNFETRKEF
jgi:hypothetical protein